MDDLTVCSTCGGDAYLMGTLGDVEHYRCRNCGVDTRIDIFEAECEFGMHVFDPYDDLDCLILSSDEELLKELGLEVSDVS